MKEKSYIKSIIKRLKCSNKKKKEIEKQLKSDISIALETGKSLDEIILKMGNPSEIAKEFNENMSKIETNIAKKRKIFIILGIVACILIVFGLLINWFLPKTKDITDSSSFDKKIVTSKSEEVINLINDVSYEILKDNYFDNKMKKSLTKSDIEKAKLSLSDNWGKFVSINKINMIELTQMGNTYVVAVVIVKYEEINVTYTLTFDKDMKLSGLYMR